jgi:hypothetical protein
MASRSNVLAFVTLTLALAAPMTAGCAAETEPTSLEPVAETEQQELTAAASRLVGRYQESTSAPGELVRLSLRDDGSYSATLRLATIAAASAPSPFVDESGTWRATRSGVSLRLRLRPAGAQPRSYDAIRAGKKLSLRGQGVTQVLSVSAPNQCFDDADCSADQACSVQVCTMACLPGDPLCCGPRTCEPKAPEACGPVTCGTGTVCCNPLAGICTPPGCACAQ